MFVRGAWQTKTSTTPRIEFLESHHQHNVDRPKTELISIYSLLAIARYPELSQGRQKWPSVGVKHDTLKNHGDTIVADIHQLLEYAQAGTQGTTRTPRDMPAKTYKPLFESILSFVQRATRPNKNEVERQREMHNMTKDIRTNVTIIKANNSNMTMGFQPKNASNTRNWAQIASAVAAPPSIQKTISGVSSAASSIDSPKHKEIVIRYKSNKPVSDSLRKLRKLRPAELVKALNDALSRAEPPKFRPPESQRRASMAVARLLPTQRPLPRPKYIDTIGRAGSSSSLRMRRS
jgi:hypothetical protein